MNLKNAFEQLSLELNQDLTSWQAIEQKLNLQQTPTSDQKAALDLIKMVYLQPEKKETHQALDNTPQDFLIAFFQVKADDKAYLTALRSSVAIEFEQVHHALNAANLPSFLTKAVDTSKALLNKAQSVADTIDKVKHPEQWLRGRILPSVGSALYSGASYLASGAYSLGNMAYGYWRGEEQKDEQQPQASTSNSHETSSSAMMLAAMPNQIDSDKALQQAQAESAELKSITSPKVEPAIAKPKPELELEATHSSSATASL